MSSKPFGRVQGSQLTASFFQDTVSWTSRGHQGIILLCCGVSYLPQVLSASMFPSNTIPLQQHPAVPDFAAPRTTIADALRSPRHAKVL